MLLEIEIEIGTPERTRAWTLGAVGWASRLLSARIRMRPPYAPLPVLLACFAGGCTISVMQEGWVEGVRVVEERSRVMSLGGHGWAAWRVRMVHRGKETPAACLQALRACPTLDASVGAMETHRQQAVAQECPSAHRFATVHTRQGPANGSPAQTQASAATVEISALGKSVACQSCDQLSQRQLCGVGPCRPQRPVPSR